MTGNNFSLDHRFRLSQAQLGRAQTEEIRESIRKGVSRSWERRDGLPPDRPLREIELAWLQERGICALRDRFPSLVDCLGGDQVAEMVADSAVLSGTQTQSRSRLVFAAKSLRRQLCAWLGQRLADNGGVLPALPDLREAHPVAYQGFVRFFALMHALREVDCEERSARSAGGSSPEPEYDAGPAPGAGPGLHELLATDPAFRDLWMDD
ncbi:hypothetical protein QBZ16_001249 [Prototheca wickerhamii]|uniref:Uncharacterized protein n=1 Tax=Prototheca wickerhamii TaxID=3111 RepID=A0AAD9IED1_PROWI|nr:hypothetical protein QBZ16_001249 [Prototheca wickerhamii]